MRTRPAHKRRASGSARRKLQKRTSLLNVYQWPSHADELVSNRGGHLSSSKRIQEEEDAAKAYKDFVASFEDANDVRLGSNGRAGLKTFVKAGSGEGFTARVACDFVLIQKPL